MSTQTSGLSRRNRKYQKHKNHLEPTSTRLQLSLTPMLSILLKGETDFIEPQLLWNHTKSERFLIWRIGIVYYLNLSLKHFFPHRKRQFFPETVIVPRFNAFAHAQSTYFPIEDIRRGKAISPSSQTTGSSVKSITQTLHTSCRYQVNPYPDRLVPRSTSTWKVQ